MKQSEGLVSIVVIIMLVLVIATHILSLLSNNMPLFAERRIMVHERSRMLNLITDFQNTESNKTRGVQRNSLSSIIIKNMSGISITSPPTLKSNNNNTYYYKTPINSSQLTTPSKNNPSNIIEVGNGVPNCTGRTNIYCSSIQ